MFGRIMKAGSILKSNFAGVDYISIYYEDGLIHTNFSPLRKRKVEYNDRESVGGREFSTNTQT
jgi:hypothetical protein